MTHAEKAAFLLVIANPEKLLCLAVPTVAVKPDSSHLCCKRRNQPLASSVWHDLPMITAVLPAACPALRVLLFAVSPSRANTFSAGLTLPFMGFHPIQVCYGIVKNKDSKPIMTSDHDRVVQPERILNKDSKEYNLSIVIQNVEFSDSGKYTCAVKNPKEKGAKHNATIFLEVVVECECCPGNCHAHGNAQALSPRTFFTDQWQPLRVLSKVRREKEPGPQAYKALCRLPFSHVSF